MADLKAGILPVTPLQQNCTLMWDDESKKGAIIDPGGDVATIRQTIEGQGIEIERILLTHGHIDHAGGAAELAEALDVGIEGPHQEDAFLLENLETAGAEYGLVGARDVTPGRWLKEGDSVAIGPFNFDVLHCPGHTPGHVVFFDADSKLAIVGDVLFRGSVGRTDFEYGDHQALIDAIKTKLLPLGDDVGFLCGHGPPSTMGQERQTNPFLQ